MEERKLTKADIDKVRNVEGFPLAKDEDIIALSRPPYYTACPNPFIEDFIKENGTPYNEATDDYHREPFAADVSEGKNDPIYNAHSYHTKVPHKAIMRYILHYTKPGDIVLDGFCGTGMTGVAAQMCENPDASFRAQIESEMGSDKVQWGARKAILGDLSPAAAFIAANYNMPVVLDDFEEEAKRIIQYADQNLAWMFETQHVDDKGDPIIGIEGKPIMGRINFAVWSDVFVCPSCSKEIVFWDAAVDTEKKAILDKWECPNCHSVLSKKDCNYQFVSQYDDIAGKVVTTKKQVPVLINYRVGKQRFTKKTDAFDEIIMDRINSMPMASIVKPSLMMGIGADWGETWRAGYHAGIEYAHQFYTRRNLISIALILKEASKGGYTYANQLINYLRSSLSYSTKLVKVNVGRLLNGGGLFAFGSVSGTLYIPSLMGERPVLDAYESKLSQIRKTMLPTKGHNVITSTVSAESIVPVDNSIDYIFTDPPFGDNLIYSELNFLWESWLGIVTNNSDEAIICKAQGKQLPEYQDLMEKCFAQYYKALKPNRWITVEFHNSRNSVWNAIQEGLQKVGFIIADVRTLDKKQGSFKQETSQGAVKQDLVISAYKPRESFIREFHQRAGDPEMAWEFVRQHLRNVPVTADGNHDGKLDIIAERQGYLLFDRMVAWHIMNGIPVPMDAHTFYEGLRQRFLVRDGMFFLPDQVNEYDDKRAHMELDVLEMELVPIDEKSSIAWLNMKLSQGPMTYQQIQPLYMQELHQSSQEKMPELLDMLKENFVQDEKGAWYVPDLTNAADLAKVRRKALLKEFWDSCATGKGKLKVFRMEAIRAGFDECWKLRDYKTIVSVGERLPEAVLQEDPALLMYYDNACSRV